MERAIARRESFVLRGLAKQSKTAKQVKVNAQSQAKKQMSELAKKIKVMRAELINSDENIQQMQYFYSFIFLYLHRFLLIISSFARAMGCKPGGCKGR